jgi:hypothetical protein
MNANNFGVIVLYYFQNTNFAQNQSQTAKVYSHKPYLYYNIHFNHRQIKVL